MAVNPDIFKFYDIRGIYPEELNEETAFNIGRAFVRYCKAKKAVIGHDARTSSPALFKAFAKGVKAEGAEIYDIGQVPSECLYFAVGKYDFDAGVMVTASHNPKEYNGLKMIRKDSGNIEMVRGNDLLMTVEESDLKKFDGQKIEIEKKDIWHDFLNHTISLVDLSEMAPLKVVVDASNGVAGLAISKMKDKLPVEIISLNFEPDGNFPNHSPNPLVEGSSDQIKSKIKEAQADFGLIFDADGDRIFLVDENSNMVPADIVLVLLAKYFLEKNPGMAVAYNLICSKAVPEFIKNFGGIPIRTQVGFVNVRDGLLKNNGIMGGELSGHYCYKDNFYMDSGVISFLTLLIIFSKDQRKVSEIVKEFFSYAKGPEINFEVEDKDAIIEKIKEKYSDGKQDFLDGITVEYDNWWFNARASNTEPLLRLTIEADTEELLKQKSREIKDFISRGSSVNRKFIGTKRAFRIY